MDKRCKEASNSASFEALNQKKIVQSRSRVLHLPPAHTATSGVGSAPQPPSGLSPGHTLPSRHVRKSRGPPPQRVSQQGDLLFVLAPPAAAGALINPCLKKKSEIFFFNAKVLCHLQFNLARFTYMYNGTLYSIIFPTQGIPYRPFPPLGDLP